MMERLAVLGLLALGLIGCSTDLGPPWTRVGVVIQADGTPYPSYFSAPVGGTVVFANQGVVARTVSFGPPMNYSSTAQPGGTCTFRMPSEDPGYAIGFSVSGNDGSGGSGSVVLYRP